MYQIILFLHLFIGIALIALVLIQQGKGAVEGAGLSAAGASQTLFGSQGANSFLFRLTGGFALAFFLTCLTLGYLVNYEVKHKKQAKIERLRVPSYPTKTFD